MVSLTDKQAERLWDLVVEGVTRIWEEPNSDEREQALRKLKAEFVEILTYGSSTEAGKRG